MPPITPLALACLVCGTLLSAEPAEPMEVTGTPDGRLHLMAGGEEVLGLSPFAADGSWKFAWPTAVAGDGPARFELKIGAAVLPGSLSAAAVDGRVQAAWTFTPAADLAFNSLAVTAELPIGVLGGGTWEVDGRSGVFPRAFAGSPGIFGGEGRSLAIAFPDGRRVGFAFAQPTWVGLQDNRQWSGTTFSIRMGKGVGRLAAGERYELGVAIAAERPLAFRRDQPVVLAAGAEWIPLRTELDILPGSALDLSANGLADGPCGGKGRVIVAPEGHFAYADEPRVPRRFYGVNLCFSAQYMPKDQVDAMLDRLVRMGYNTVRIHHYEYRLTSPDWKPGLDWDPARVDQLDYLMAGCAARGLWLTTDLYVSRPVPGRQIGLAGERPDPGLFKLMVPVHEPAFQDWAAFARKLLDRVNPYTGRRVADDPALAWIALINEGPVAGGWDQAKRTPQWNAAWNRWLAATWPDRDALDLALGDLADAEDPAAGTVAMPDSVKAGTRRARAAQVFLADTEAAMFRRMRAFLRDELGCPALLTDLNCGPNQVPMQATRAAEFDYVDDHFYVDHPVFLDRQWQLPSRCPNANPIREGAPGGAASAALRVWGKPMTVSEFDYSGPGRFRGVGGVLTGALAALQDWGAVWRFAYAHKDADVFAPAPIDYFNLVNDPLNLAADRAAVLLYLRRDLAAAPGRVAAVLTRAELRSPPPRLGLGGLEAAAWTTRVGSAVVDDPAQAPADAVRVPLRQAGDRAAVLAALRAAGLPAEGEERVIRSETGEIAIDRRHGVLTIDTARTAGGYADPGQAVDAAGAGVRIDGVDAGATVFVSSLDRTPIRAAPRLLVTHLTDLQNTGMRYGESARQNLLAWGGLPHLVRAGSARVSIALDDPGAYAVWALSTAGRRVERVAAAVAGGRLVFTARVEGAEGARMLYEVVR